MTVAVKSDADMEAWVAEQRRLYAAGQLPQWKVRRLEQIPGWTWAHVDKC